MLLAIDPGADMGWATFGADDHLVTCGVGVVSLGMPSSPAPTRVVVERPMIYPHGKQEARPRDVITLAVRAGEAGGLYARTFGVEPEYFEPDEWKGGAVSKAAHHPRVWATLTPAEQRIVSLAAASMAKGKHHNMLDAIGIGLFATGRMVGPRGARRAMMHARTRAA